MKKALLLASAALLATTGAAMAGGHAKTVNIGVILGFTGPIESLTPDMAAAAELAMKEVNDSGMLMEGAMTLNAVRADSTCIDSQAANAAAERLIDSDDVAAIVGADCSGVTGSILSNVAVPKGVAMISPSATSPGLSAAADEGLFFRTAPSDARQGQVLADILNDRGISDIAVTYTNNDYGKGLADSFATAFAAAGGSVSISAPHEDGKGDYSAEVGSLAAAGSEVLAVFGYLDQGGLGIIENSIDTGAFDTFVFADGMVGSSIMEAIGADMGGSFGTLPGNESDGAATFTEMMGGEAGPFTAESYDAAALIALAIQKGGSAERADIAANILSVANAPGEEIQPGELGKALEILAAGGDVNYVGASSVELNDIGETLGSYKELEVVDGDYETKAIR